MHTKTMEGLVGASTNMNLLNTPFRVYKEARRKGDTGTMERAMGYVNECSDKAQEYRVKAEEGMEEDAKEAREKPRQSVRPISKDAGRSARSWKSRWRRAKIRIPIQLRSAGTTRQ